MQSRFWLEKRVKSNKAKVFSLCWRIFLVLACLSIVTYWILLKVSGFAFIQPKKLLSKTPPSTKVDDLLGILHKSGKFFYLKSDGTLIRKYSSTDFNLPYILSLDKNNITIAVSFLKQMYSLKPIISKISFEDIENIKMYLKGNIVVEVGSLENLDEKLNKLRLLIINYSKLPEDLKAIDLRWKDVIIKTDNFDSG